jgi:multidrug efflux system membrane fusion protein
MEVGADGSEGRAQIMSKRTIIIVAACVVLLIGWWTCHRGGDAKSSQAGGGRRGNFAGMAVPVIAGKVEQKDVPIYLDGLGTVEAFNTDTVHTRVDGELTQVLFQEGQQVKAGDLLAVVDPRPYQAALDQVVAKKAQDEAQLENAQLTLVRNTDLLQRKVIDQQDFDTAKYSVDQFNGAVQADQAAIENAKTQLDYTQIKSPIDGRTGIRMIDVGNIVHAADTNGIVVITQLRPISVMFTLPEQNLQEILDEGGANGGLAVSALNRGDTRPIDEGKLAVVDNEIDQTTGTVKLKATFPNPDLKLWPGEFVNARLVLKTEKNATVVPAAVVQRGPQGSYAYVIKPDNTAELRPIKVAQTENNMTLITEGLKPGEEVVVDGQYKLQPGAKVELAGPQSGSPHPPGDGQSPNGKQPRRKKS